VRGERGSGGRCKAAAFLGRAAVSNCGRGLGFVSSKSRTANRAEEERGRERERERGIGKSRVEKRAGDCRSKGNSRGREQSSKIAPGSGGGEDARG